MADAIVFWVPRDLAVLPAFTTNVEFGLWADSGKAVLGYPSEAAKMGFLRWHADRVNMPTASTLEATLRLALQRLDDGAERADGEREIPLRLWRTTAFQKWYRAQRKAGNRLDGARVLWCHEGGPETGEHPFAWAVQVNVFVAAEKRNKTNEFVLARPDTCAVCAYLPATRLEDSLVVLVREFRSPALTGDGFIVELPGGSAKDPLEAMAAVARAELLEETGLDLPPERFRPVRSRQVNGTFSVHRCHLFAVQMNIGEAAILQKMSCQTKGKAADSERIQVAIKSIGEILAGEPLLDWSNMGMVWETLNHVRQFHQGIPDADESEDEK
jgi:hypothetical protein